MQTAQDEFSALTDATQRGDAKAVAQLLAQSPTLIHERSPYDWSALHYAVFEGHDTIVAQLLEAGSSELACAADKSNQTALHLAVHGKKESHNKIIARLLAASPGLIDVVDFHGWNVLHHACHMSNDSMAEEFLTHKPEFAFAITKSGNTALHLAARGIRRSRNVLKGLMELNPNALQTLNTYHEPPFCIAVEVGNEVAIEEMKSRLSLDEIVSAFVSNHKSFEHFRPMVESQCECLWVLLHRDVVATVYEYLGFDSVKRPNNKRGRADSESPL